MSTHKRKSREDETGYNFAYLDEQTKRMIRRCILKAVAVPGYQVPFGSREMPLPYGWGTGGIQVTASIIGRDDILKVIDQGSDDTTNAVSIRAFFARTAGIETTEQTAKASVIQTRHRTPERNLRADQIMVYQVPIPEPLRFLEPRETECRKIHAWSEYGVMQVKLYEDIAKFGRITTAYAYPVKVQGRYVMDPSSQATVIEHYVGLGDKPYFTNVVTEAVMGQNAQLTRCRVQQESDRGYHTASFFAHQTRDSRVFNHGFDLGGRLARTDTNARLVDPNAEVHFYGVYVPTGRQHMDKRVLAEILGKLQCRRDKRSGGGRRSSRPVLAASR